ncbi:cupin domain-containing protein [Azospirillum canadense]|uniref:cupin domain-containing protein n=1 Tax=Azospirillum canadense TaxID=403962 RepID=UPI0029CAAC6C|nr:cupin domain-containing protein [Azospirillum canadense]
MQHAGAEPERLQLRRIVPGVYRSAWAIGAAQASVCMPNVDPGRRVPAHRHTDTEMLLVLKGAFRDEYGQYDGYADQRRGCPAPQKIVILPLVHLTIAEFLT